MILHDWNMDESGRRVGLCEPVPWTCPRCGVSVLSVGSPIEEAGVVQIFSWTEKKLKPAHDMRRSGTSVFGPISTDCEKVVLGIVMAS